MPTLLRDLRHGVRLLRQNPGFTAIAILSLALGIGANTAIFQLIDTVRLRTLPVSEPQRLALIQFVDPTKQRGSHATAFRPLPTRSGSAFATHKTCSPACWRGGTTTLPCPPEATSGWREGCS
jgi:hypothetical protein